MISGSLKNVSFNEFTKIVHEMKPEIGSFGGRYFVYNKKMYTMNQLTKRFCDEVRSKGSGWLPKAASDWSNVAATLYNKDQKATEMLNQASCFQKTMTKIKQKIGNSRFKDFYGVNKTAVLQAFAPAAAEEALPIAIKDLKKIDSSKQVNLKEEHLPSPVILSYSNDLFPESLLKRLIKNKQELTDMEKSFHNFIASLSQTFLSVGPQENICGILCETERNYQIATLQGQVLEGKVYAFPEEGFNAPDYEESLHRHLIYHLTKEHRLPCKSEVEPRKFNECMELLKPMLKEDMGLDEIRIRLKNEVVCNRNGQLISLEVVFNLLHNQLRNEVRLLEKTLTQGYIYGLPRFQYSNIDIDIFKFLFILALKFVHKETPLNEMKIAVYFDLAGEYVEELKKIFPDKVRQRSLNLLEEFKGAALVIDERQHSLAVSDHFICSESNGLKKLD